LKGKKPMKKNLLPISMVSAFSFAALFYALASSAGLGLVDNIAPSTSTAPSLWVTPLVLDFGPVGVGETSDQLTVTINNAGNDTLTNFAGGGVFPPFTASQNCAGGVAPGGTCQYFFAFSPTTTGIFSGTSNSSTNAGTFSIELRGEGVGARVHVTNPSLDFGRVNIGGTSAQQAATIRNTGLSTLVNFSGGGVQSPFSASQNCFGGVPPGGNCQYFFTFSPTEIGLFTETSTTQTDAGQFSIDLMGKGATLAAFGQRVTPRALDFGPVGVGLSGGTLAVNIINQNFSTSITDWVIDSIQPPFAVNENCTPSLAAGDTCQFTYTIEPTETGIFTTTSNASNSAGLFSIGLRGEGMGPGLSVSPLVLDFGYSDYGQPQGVTVKNTGMAGLSAFVGGEVPMPFSVTQNCPDVVPPGGTCQFTYSFNPIEYDEYAKTSNVSTNAGSFSILLLGGLKAPSPHLSFLPAQIYPSETTNLQYTIQNPNPGATLFAVNFNNDLPYGMSVAEPLSYSTSAECGSPNFAPIVGNTTILLGDSTIRSGDECVINVNVTAAEIGLYTNKVEVLASDTGRGSASGSLMVGSLLYLPKVAR
jgi:hypothetical protein